MSNSNSKTKEGWFHTPVINTVHKSAGAFVNHHQQVYNYILFFNRQQELVLDIHGKLKIMVIS